MQAVSRTPATSCANTWAVPGGNEGATASTDLGWDNNLHIYRFAETLLNAAELGLALGRCRCTALF